MLVAEANAAPGPGAAPVIGAVLVRAYDTPSDPAMVPLPVRGHRPGAGMRGDQ